MTTVYHDNRPGDFTGWTVERTIRHKGGDLYEAEKREITPSSPEGRIVMGAPAEFTLRGGVVRWVSNGSILMADVVRDFAIDQVPGFVKSVHEAAYAAHCDEFMRAYASSQPSRPSDEELYEMRANHPPGTVLVDVISGRRTQL
jgi:hypothetical protein